MPAKTLPLCVVCETLRVERESDDPDVCLACQRRIDEIVADPMLAARANGTIIDAIYPKECESRDQAIMLGFLSAFHPQMPMKQRMELALGQKLDYQLK
jgi:predicted Fe-S protein YdhL (DUF1289 family)